MAKKATKNKKPKLTFKEKGFVKDYIETRGNGTQSIKNNYNIKSNDVDNVAAVMAVEKLSKPKIQSALEEALPDDLLAEKHLALLKKKDKEGDIDVIAVKYGLDMAYKIKGSYAPEKKQTVHATIHMDVKTKEIVDRYEEEFRQSLLE